MEPAERDGSGNTQQFKFSRATMNHIHSIKGSPKILVCKTVIDLRLWLLCNLVPSALCALSCSSFVSDRNPNLRMYAHVQSILLILCGKFYRFILWIKGFSWLLGHFSGLASE